MPCRYLAHSASAKTITGHWTRELQGFGEQERGLGTGAYIGKWSPSERLTGYVSGNQLPYTDVFSAADRVSPLFSEPRSISIQCTAICGQLHAMPSVWVSKVRMSETRNELCGNRGIRVRGTGWGARYRSAGVVDTQRSAHPCRCRDLSQRTAGEKHSLFFLQGL